MILILPVQLTCGAVESPKRLLISWPWKPILALGILSTIVQVQIRPRATLQGPTPFSLSWLQGSCEHTVAWQHASLYPSSSPNCSSKIFAANKNETKQRFIQSHLEYVKHVSRHNSAVFFWAFLDMLILQNRKYQFWWNVILSLNQTKYAGYLGWIRHIISPNMASRTSFFAGIFIPLFGDKEVLILYTWIFQECKKEAVPFQKTHLSRQNFTYLEDPKRCLYMYDVIIRYVATYLPRFLLDLAFHRSFSLPAETPRTYAGEIPSMKQGWSQKLPLNMANEHGNNLFVDLAAVHTCENPPCFVFFLAGWGEEHGDMKFQWASGNETSVLK